MTTISDVTSSLKVMHLDSTNEWTENNMETDHRPPLPELVDEMDICKLEGEREMYEIYVDSADDAAEAREIYSSIVSDVVGGHENAIAVLASEILDFNCFSVYLTRTELKKLVEIDNERVRGIYPPYKPD